MIERGAFGRLLGALISYYGLPSAQGALGRTGRSGGGGETGRER